MEAQLVPQVAVSAAVEWDSFSVRNLNRFSAGGWEDWEEAEMAADADGSAGTLLTISQHVYLQTKSIHLIILKERERTLKAVNQSDWICQPSNQPINNK